MALHQFVFATGIIALCTSFYVILKSLYEVFTLYVNPSIGKPLRSYGKWAVITGGSDGIGKALAEEIAKDGLNLCFIARNATKMDKISREIRKTFNVETRVVVADLCNTSSYEYIDSQIEEIDDIGLLVNCAGVNIGQKLMVEIDAQACLDLINTNISAAVWLTKTVASKMIANRRGLIVNFSSLTPIFRPNLHAPYTASKSFIDSLTENLEHELSPHNVRVKCLRPGFVRTKLCEDDPKTREMALISPKFYLTPAIYAKSAVACLKVEHSPREMIGNLRHWVYAAVLRFFILGADNRPARIELLSALGSRIRS